MITVGCGCRNDWHIQDISEDGKWIEEAAVKNRKVMVIDASELDESVLEPFLN